MSCKCHSLFCVPTPSPPTIFLRPSLPPLQPAQKRHRPTPTTSSLLSPPPTAPLSTPHTRHRPHNSHTSHGPVFVPNEKTLQRKQPRTAPSSGDHGPSTSGIIQSSIGAVQSTTRISLSTDGTAPSTSMGDLFVPGTGLSTTQPRGVTLRPASRDIAMETSQSHLAPSKPSVPFTPLLTAAASYTRPPSSASSSFLPFSPSRPSSSLASIRFSAPPLPSLSSSPDRSGHSVSPDHPSLSSTSPPPRIPHHFTPTFHVSVLCSML